VEYVAHHIAATVLTMAEIKDCSSHIGAQRAKLMATCVVPTEMLTATILRVSSLTVLES